jgi:hypothetical protein
MDTFNDEERTDLEERGFTNEQIETLEALDFNKETLHSDICYMHDRQMTPEEIIDFYNT